MRMLKQRIEDKALLNLINQWLKARIKSPEGVFEKPTSGDPQGGVISPVLATFMTKKDTCTTHWIFGLRNA